MFFYLKEKYLASSYNQGTTFTKEMLNGFPVPKITLENQGKIISIVDQILSAKRKVPGVDTMKWEREIDQLVYQLYGLTEDEIKIVEGAK
jgi:type II restriction/modification system DNA methylase subunit YeeA